MSKWIVWVAAALALCIIVGWRVVGKTRDAAQLQAQQDQRRKAAPNVEVATAGPAVLDETVDAVGTVLSPYSVKLSAKSTGTIDYLEVREGADVKPGQVLVKINPSDLQGAVYMQEAAVAAARARLAQAAITQGSNDTSVRATIHQNQAGLQSAKADYNQTAQNYAAQVAAAEAQVADGDAKVAAAQSGISSAQADLGSARANLKDAQLKLQRTETLFKQQYVAAQDVDDARAAVAVQQGAVDVAVQKVAAAKSALVSASALRDAAAKQASIVKTKGLSDIEAAKARYTQAGASYNVAKANIALTPAYRENLAALRAEVSAAAAQLTSARAKLSDTVLMSSIEGTVTSRAADPGTVVTPGQQILTVQYLKWLYVSASLPVEQSSKVFPGQRASVTFDAIPGRTFTGKVSDVNPAADPLSRQFTLNVKLLNPQGLIRPGMFGHVHLVISTVHAAIAVPREAVANAQSHPTVTVVGDDLVAHTRDVEIGVTDGARYEIKSGLQPGDRVVTLAYTPVRDGQKVRLGGPAKQRGGGRT